MYLHRESRSSQRPISLKAVGIVFLCLVAVLCGLFVLAFPSSNPPKEKKLIESFCAHRAVFERLRDMLQEDKNLLRLADWGVETTKSPPHRVQEGVDFPVNRYNEYLSLLGQIGARGALRGRGEHPESVGVLMWASGWAGDTRHVEICWMDHEPASQVASLDAYYRTAKPRTPVFRHLDGNWYLWADW